MNTDTTIASPTSIVNWLSPGCRHPRHYFRRRTSLPIDPTWPRLSLLHPNHCPPNVLLHCDDLGPESDLDVALGGAFERGRVERAEVRDVDDGAGACLGLDFGIGGWEETVRPVGGEGRERAEEVERAFEV